MMFRRGFNSALLLFSIIVFSACQVFAKDRIKLTDVEVVTLYKDKFTTGRRSQPVPQLTCVGGSAGCSSHLPQVVQCYNRGFDGHDVQWECKADLNSGYKFGEIQVTCEGYDWPDDPYILSGSCGLEYKLESTNGGSYSDGYSYGKPSNSHNKQKSSIFADLVFYAIVAVAIYTIYRIYVNMNDPNRPRGTGGSGGTGGFGGGPGDGGPPPPGFRPDYYPGDSCGGASSQQYGAGTYGRYGGGHQGNRPGFWTGLGAGGLLGYMMGNNRGGGYMNRPTTSFWDSGPSTHARSSTSSHFGGGGGGGTHTSSGFGGTRRR